jgi:murein DD-endopeptidase MepM/ murein hydrolase activator NlpD
MLMTTKTVRGRLLLSLEGALLVATVLSQAQLVFAQAIIDNGSFVQMGINAAGHLNVPGGTLSMPSDSTTDVGLRYIPTNGESVAPGCLCEGWGVANADLGTGTFAGYANIFTDGGVVDLVVQPGTGVTQTTGQIKPESVGSAFKSIVKTINGRLRITHDYHPSTSPNLYEVKVKIENIGTTPIGDLRYRRVMDWDIAPDTFSEFVEIHVGTTPDLIRATTDGFASANPLSVFSPDAGSPPTTLFRGSTDYFSGPSDQGALFDFKFGTLSAGKSVTFKIYYGAAKDRTEALAATAAVRADLYSFGIPETSSGGPDTDGPHVFIFAFTFVPPFLSFPVANCNGTPCTPFNAQIISVMDHSFTPLDANNPAPRWYLHDDKVRAYTGEEGQIQFGSNAPPTGYKKDAEGTPFIINGSYRGTPGKDGITDVGPCTLKLNGKNKKVKCSPAKSYLNYDGHSGYDYSFSKLPATAIVAPASGRLFKAATDTVNHTSSCNSTNTNGWNEWHSFYIDHGNGFTTWYLHTDHLDPTIEAQIGTDFSKFVTVNRGQTVAFVGDFQAKCTMTTKTAIRPHLHFEARRGLSEVVDPYSDGLWSDSP